MVELLVGLPPAALLAIGGLLVVAEAGLLVGVFLPGASTLLTVGFLTSHHVAPLATAMAVMALAAPLGGHLAYLSGLRRPGRVCRQGWQRAGHLLDRHGVLAVALGQYVVVARTLVPRLAGVSGMPYRRFALWHLPAASLWGSVGVLVGNLAGQAYERVGTVIALVGVAALALLLSIARRVTSGAGSVKEFTDPLVKFDERPLSFTGTSATSQQTKPLHDMS